MNSGIFSNAAFMKMVYSVIFWIVFYVIIKILTVNAGIGTNLLNQCLKRVPKLHRSTIELRLLCTDSSSKNTEKQLKCLSDVIKSEQRISKILEVYLFDDKNDQDVLAARKLYDSIPDICRAIVVQTSEGDMGDIGDKFKTIDANIKSAEEYIKKAISLDLKKKLLKI